METINNQDVFKQDVLNKINNLNEQISIRETIPAYQRTEKQSIKLDNLIYELKQLYIQLNNNKY